MYPSSRTFVVVSLVLCSLLNTICSRTHFAEVQILGPTPEILDGYTWFKPLLFLVVPFHLCAIITEQTYPLGVIDEEYWTVSSMLACKPSLNLSDINVLTPLPSKGNQFEDHSVDIWGLWAQRDLREPGKTVRTERLTLLRSHSESDCTWWWPPPTYQAIRGEGGRRTLRSGHQTGWIQLDWRGGEWGWARV